MTGRAAIASRPRVETWTTSVGRSPDARRAVAALMAGALILVALPACDPSPAFPPAEQPLVGVVLWEAEMLGGEGLVVPQGTSTAATLFVPVTDPPGARLRVRLLGDVPQALPDGASTDMWRVSGHTAALQILPATVTFPSPAVLELMRFLPRDSEATILHANEADPTWQRRGPATALPPVSGSAPSVPVAVRVAIDGPHLWSLEIRPTGTGAADAGAD